MEFTSLTKYQRYFHESIPVFRHNKYIQIVVLRETKSHAIFTTEGDTLDTEILQAGYIPANASQKLDRVVMFKRKQIASERRTGKALLRQFAVLGGENETEEDNKGKKKKPEKLKSCYLMDGMCGKCPDCVLYGFAAVKNESSQKSRVLTDSSFSLRSYSKIQKMVKLNAIQDKTEGGISGSAFAEKDTLIPQIFLPSVETLVDVTPHELIYVLGNILQTTRYGSESNRQGYIRNHLVAVSFGNVEKLSNLDLTQRLYDKLAPQGHLNDILDLSNFINGDGHSGNIFDVVNEVLAQLPGHSMIMSSEDLELLLSEFNSVFSDLDICKNFLNELNQASVKYAGTKGKDQKTGMTE
ncbi:MAG: type I-D CRISPR-associated protein Cas7/Csc2 [Cylindrospermopsis raciborskii]|jgi:CRISPR-associated protein Csc2|uniref:type I-D CRISPR-associated protein Cas7/Csc2 n=1 Tax=Cylindrospermopsis raciborskii TaxID=77022 RepID=UPI003D0D3E14